MKYHVITAGLLLPVLTLLFSCSDEAAPEAYQGDEPVVHETTLPQGNHDYDNTIMDWHKKYGVYPLYKFSDEDWFWSVTGDIRWSYDASRDQTNAGYKIYQGEETQVGNLISLLQQRVFCYFPDSVLKSILPQKMLLAGRIVHNPGSLHGEVPESQYIDENTLAGFDYVAFAGATEKIVSMTRKDSVGYGRLCPEGRLVHPIYLCGLTGLDEIRSNHCQYAIQRDAGQISQQVSDDGAEV